MLFEEYMEVLKLDKFRKLSKFSARIIISTKSVTVNKFCDALKNITGDQARLHNKLYRLLCSLFRRIAISIVGHDLIRRSGIKSCVAVDGAVRC